MSIIGRWYLIIIALLALAVPAHADCTASFNPGGGGGLTPTPVPTATRTPASVTLDGCAPNQSDTINITRVNSFDSRFADIQNQITVNRSEARAGIAMAMAAASMGVGSAASGAGAGKVAAGLGAADFQGTVSLSAGIAYAVNKRFNLSGGVSVAPVNGPPMYGIYGGATLILN